MNTFVCQNNQTWHVLSEKNHISAHGELSIKESVRFPLRSLSLDHHCKKYTWEGKKKTQDIQWIHKKSPNMWNISANLFHRKDLTLESAALYFAFIFSAHFKSDLEMRFAKGNSKRILICFQWGDQMFSVRMNFAFHFFFLFTGKWCYFAGENTITITLLLERGLQRAPL